MSTKKKNTGAVIELTTVPPPGDPLLVAITYAAGRGAQGGMKGLGIAAAAEVWRYAARAGLTADDFTMDIGLLGFVRTVAQVARHSTGEDEKQASKAVWEGLVAYATRSIPQTPKLTQLYRQLDKVWQFQLAHFEKAAAERGLTVKLPAEACANPSSGEPVRTFPRPPHLP